MFKSVLRQTFSILLDLYKGFLDRDMEILKINDKLLVHQVKELKEELKEV